jgi:phytoene dehydrogenase-like protein
MARVIVIGAGLAGLATAMEASVRGHHVVVLDQRSTIGGRASSELRDDFPIGFGPHFLLKKGPLHRLVLKISRMKPSTLPLRPHRIELVGKGMMQPRSPMMDAVLYRRAVRKYEVAHPSIRAAEQFASWGMGSEVRSKALLRSKLLGLKEGWSGLIGRLAVTLDEVGIPIETGAKVTQVERNKSTLPMDATLKPM